MDGLYDPLSLSLPRASLSLLEALHLSPEAVSSSASTPSSPYPFLPLSHLAPLYAVATGTQAFAPVEFVDVLADLLEIPELGIEVARCFRPIIMLLLGRWIERSRGGRDEWIRRVSMGAKLAEGIEELWPIVSHIICSSPYTLLPPDALSQSPKVLHPLLLAHLRLLSLSSPSLLPDSFLSLQILRSLFTAPHPDPATRLLAVRVHALATHVAERLRHEWEEKTLGTPLGEGDLRWYEGDGIFLSDEKEVTVAEVWKSAWVWPVLEQERLAAFFTWSESNGALYESSAFTLSQEPQLQLPSSILLIAERILVFRAPSSNTSTPKHPFTHIPTPTSTATLQRLTLNLSSSTPTLLTSPPSSGKTHLLSFLAHLLSPSLSPLTISLADTSLDPKSLLGNYVSSPTDPGQFVWVQGALAKAVAEGRWVILEDVDRAGGEVLSLVGGLAESMRRGTRKIGDRGVLKVPGREDVAMAEGFRLFATRTVAPYASTGAGTDRELEFPKATFLNAQKFEEVVLPPPSREEICMILEERFQTLGKESVKRLMKAWEIAGQGIGGSETGGYKSRDVGLRDLVKWFGRVESLVASAGSSQVFSSDGSIINPVLQEEIFVEACDVFFGSLPKVSSAGARAVGAELGLNDERTIWCLERRRPELILVGGADGGEVKQVKIGRGRLRCKTTKQAYYDSTTQRPFALTRPSLLLLEQISVATSHLEPILLVGETGTGKTTAITYLSDLLRRPLISLNLSTQTESSDLLGGFKPLDPKIPAGDLLVRFGDLFGRTFSRKKNKRFEEVVRKAVGGGKWGRCVEMWTEAGRLAKDRLRSRKEGKGDDDDAAAEGATVEEPSSSSRKRRKLASAADAIEIDGMLAEWDLFAADVSDFDIRHVRAGGRFVFSFVEGPLVKALRRGDWVLLDEVNLASPETLESLASILESSTASLVLTERGDLEPVVRHPDFRLFACMNPATDVGKKDLPATLRSRFTELYVPSPDTDREALLAIVHQYIGDVAVADRPAILDIAELYHSTKSLAEARELADGSNHPPHYSMRTLARALTFAAQITPIYGLRRSLWEGFLMSFTMLLDAKSASIVRALAEKHILGGARNPRAILAQMPNVPPGQTEDDVVRFGPFWLQRGPLEVDDASDYVLTPSVQAKLVDLARVVSSNKFPVLIQGPTSSGKTSAVEFLARRTGHRFVRINNHEHTDIQEYLGTYVSDPDTGKLVFQEGVLVRAVRRGDWIVLDELNLAPTDVLEALNRLLDDNRELVIPETQEVIRPHPHFMLFATQNPPGLYGGRKVLSRAFRNRFLEVHFDDVPQAELETILCQRCRIALSYAKRIVSVFQELQHRRQTGRVFETKQSFATLRDLFRWAGREAGDVQQLAENGYMLLAERARRNDDKIVVKEVLEQVLKVQIDEKKLYDLSTATPEEVLLRLGAPLPPPAAAASIVWTSAMQRLYTLVATALRYNEPVLLVGETGCGKTSVCQLLSEALKRQLFAVNCHQNMETADLLGGQKPLRNRAARQAALLDDLRLFFSNLDLELVSAPEADTEAIVLAADELVRSSSIAKDSLEKYRELLSSIKRAGALFEWHDGPLIEAMQSGDLVLLDEVSLADDSVLERLNSVLEPARTLVLAEKGGRDIEQMTIVASEGFQVLATMNPGGDYGKKELSPALRNRFTEIWVPSLDDHDDLLKIVQSSWKHESLAAYSEPLLQYLRWFAAELGDASTAIIGVRDILAWIQFSNAAVEKLGMASAEIFRHAAHMVVIDGLGSLPQVAGLSAASLLALRKDCIKKLDEVLGADTSSSASSRGFIVDTPEFFGIDGFAVCKGDLEDGRSDFSLRAPTTCDNAMRVLRGCQLLKPILLEGSPGVGKTSLITALAAASRNELCRINLSDQTDLADLFGSDLPVEGGKPGEFAWKDAAFLTALQTGQWVLLDEMNLASQAVLEGLNAVLDHRGTVYLPELGRSFTRHANFRIFAAQNPVGQGGGRKGLPKSFLNRFTRVYVQELSPEDLRIICAHLYPDFPADLLEKMISFNSQLHVETMVKRSFGREGSPWEFNLRDVLRWLALIHSSSGLEQEPGHPVEHLRTVYFHRFRQAADRQAVSDLFKSIFGRVAPLDCRPWPSFSPEHAQFGHALLERSSDSDPADAPLSILHAHLSPLEAIAKSISLGWLVIVSGPGSSGKTSILRLLSQLSGRRLREFTMNPGVDTMELLGSFEQADSRRRMSRIIARLSALSRKGLSTAVFDDSRWISVTASLDQLSVLLKSKDIAAFVAAASAVVAELAPVFAGSRDAEIAWVQGALSDLSSAGSTSGRFEWVDGELVQAILAGDWLVIENANLCNASVLDRINSLCETNGSLVLSERGTVDGAPQILRPHPEFRLFMTLDPRHGELSRAMRNRGIEICLDPITSPSDLDRIAYLSRLHPAIAHDLVASQLLRRSLTSSPPLARQHYEWDVFTVQDSVLTGILAHGRTLFGVQATSASGDVPASSPNVQQLADVAHLVVSLPALSSQLAQHLALGSPSSASFLPDLLYAAFSSLASSGVLQISQSLQSAVSELRQVSESFIQSQAIDLMVNPYLYDAANPQHGLASQLIELVVRNALSRYLTESSVKLSTRKAVSDLSILERSFQVASGRKLQISFDAGVEVVFPMVAAFHESVEASVQVFTTLSEPDSAQALLSLLSQMSDVMTELEKSTSTTDFNYSAMQVIGRWLLDLAARAPDTALTSLRPQLERLRDAVTYDSGSGQREIWLANLPRSPQATFLALERRLGRVLAEAASEHPDYAKLRLSAFTVAATSSLGLASTSNSDLDNLGADVERALLKIVNNEELPSTGADALARLTAVAQLDVVSGILGCSEQNAQTELRDLLSVAESLPSFPLFQMISVQHAIWSLQTQPSLDSLSKKDLLRSWLNVTWTDGDASALSGAADIFRPVVLSTLLHETDEKASSLKDLPDLEISLKRLGSVVGIHSRSDLQPRFTAIAQIFWRFVLDVCQAFASSYDANILLRLEAASIQDVLADAASLIPLLESSSHLQLRIVLGTHISPALRAFGESHPDSASKVLILGRAWVALSLATLALYVPAIPIDPAVAQQVELALLKSQQARLEAEAFAHLRAEGQITGNATNPKILAAQERLVQIETELSQLGPLIVERETNVSLLNTMFKEIHHFLGEIVDPAKLQGLADSLAQTPDAQAFLREQSAQENIAGFLQRISQTYSLFADITQPLNLALSQLRSGLRFLARSTELRTALARGQSEADLVGTLASFPTAFAVQTLHVSELPVRLKSELPAVATSRLLLLEATSIGYDIAIGLCLDPGTVQSIGLIFDQLSHLWLMDREKEAQAEQEAQSLYRQRKVDEEILSDIELEEKEFKELFPQFGDIMDEDEANDVEPEAVAAASASKSKFILPDQASELHRLHVALFSAKTGDAQKSAFLAQRENVVRNVFSGHYDALADDLDETTALQVQLLSDATARISSAPAPRNRPYDFYSDANPNEMRKAVQLVSRLHRRLAALSDEWPDQMVLRHLMDRCEAILAMNLNSAVVKVIAALEGLLLHTADWESYANRDNTLKAFQGEIGDLIVTWRRLELACWAQLLETQAVTFADSASDWWFRLYEVIVQGARAALNEDEASGATTAADNHIASVIVLLDQFISTSPIGQYSARLQLLRSFSRYLDLLATTTATSPGLARISRILASMAERYGLVEPKVIASLLSQRAKVESSIRDFIKLASWKDVNVHALKASATHTHRQLHRCIRKFREILRQPCAPLIGSPDSSDIPNGGAFADLATEHSPTEYSSKSLSTSIAALVTIDSPTSTAAHLINLPATFARFQNLLLTQIRPALVAAPTSSVNDLATEIITTSKSLAEETPSTLTEETLKIVKALLVRKRRAWGDLLKELRRIGFSANVRPNVLARQQSASSLHALAVLPRSAELVQPVLAGIDRIEGYHFRLLITMPELRDSLRSHNADLSTRDLQKGVGFVESILSIGLENRSRLAFGLDQFSRLRRIVSRLQAAAGIGPQAVGLVTDASQTIARAHDIITRLGEALREVIESRTNYGRVVDPSWGHASVPPMLDDYVQSVEETRVDLSAMMMATCLPILLDGEHATLHRTKALLFSGAGLFRDLSVAEPQFRHLYARLGDVIRPLDIDIPASCSSTEEDDTRLWQAGDRVVSSLLVVAQDLRALPPLRVVDPESMNDSADAFVTDGTQSLDRASSALRLSEIMAQLEALFAEQKASVVVAQTVIRRIIPFVSEFTLAVEDHLATSAQWTGSVYKLAFIVSATAASLSAKGFCSPQEAGETQPGDGEGGKSQEGTGMGEGTGDANVSQDIEDESQVEGLQGEDSEPQPKDQQKKEGGAIEMSEDFGGELEDVSQDGSDDEEEDQEEDDGEEAPPDEQMGDVDPLDENAVDEKLWGDEKGPEDDSKNDETLDQDRSTEQSKESEMVAKEKETPQTDPKKEKPQPEADGEDEPAPDDPEAGEEGEEEMPEQDVDDQPRGQGEKMPDHVPEADSLDLPDELNLGDEDDKEDGDQEETPMDDDHEDLPDPDIPSQKQKSPDPDEAQPPMPGDEDEPTLPEPGTEEDPALDPEEDESNKDPAQAEPGEEDAAMNSEDDSEQPSSKPKVESGDDKNDSAAAPEDVGIETGQEEAPTEQEDGARDESGKRADASTADRQDEGGDDTQDAAPTEPNQDASESRGGAGEAMPVENSQPENEDQQPQPQVDDTNPLRDLGDALKEIRKRFEQISNPTKEDDDAPPPDSRKDAEGDNSMQPAEVEYAQDDEDEEMQALGPAPDDQPVQDLSDLRIADDEKEDDRGAHAMDVDEEPQLAAERPLEIQRPEQDATAEKAITESQVRERGLNDKPDTELQPLPTIDGDEPPPLTEEEAQQLDKEVELKTREWINNDRSSASAESLWRLYTSLTHDLSHSLCEQLRLILEPTLATRLKGDYRTGKRLNMKKIVPYVASEFTKDKIWLRRTRPSTREYQVLVALDDSKSMAESHSVHLAYETLALVSQAMTKLEVGSLALASFGTAFEMLHSFEETTFSDDKGARIMSEFKFDQKATDVAGLVERSLEVLSDARNQKASTSSTSADLWQLEIIISDGICQDHDRLRTLLRKAEEQRVMIVFLIIDSLHRSTQSSFGAPEKELSQKNSILTMKTATYQADEVSGLMKLEMTPYLSTFPFENFVVLRSADALPDVLASTLRQFVERTTGGQ